jgi:hypothetical protein
VRFERDAYCAQVRFEIERWSPPGFPVSDVQSLTEERGEGLLRWYGRFSCHDISVAGKGCRIDGERRLSHMKCIVGEVRPAYVFVETSPAPFAEAWEECSVTAAPGMTRWGVLSCRWGRRTEGTGSDCCPRRPWAMRRARAQGTRSSRWRMRGSA